MKERHVILECDAVPGIPCHPAQGCAPAIKDETLMGEKNTETKCEQNKDERKHFLKVSRRTRNY